MMVRRFLLAGLVLLLITPAALAQPATTSTETTTGQHPLWKYSDEDNTVYIMGSVHILRPEVYPLDPVLQEAYEQAEVVAFEVHLDSMQQKMPAMMQEARLAEGTLQDVLEADTYQRLSATMDSLGFPPQVKSNFEQMKPWIVGMALPQIVLTRSGYQLDAGIEMHFYQKVAQSDKTIMGLETVEDQVEALETITDADPDAFIASTLDDLEGVTAMIDSMTAAWKRGDVETLGTMMTESMEGYPKMREVMLVKRNQDWIAPITSLMDGDRNALVIVGAGHLVGEDSVIDLLTERGYTLVQQ